MVPGSDFIVSRTAKKDNSSVYSIANPSTADPKRVQFKEISTLLQSHGIDLKYNRFLILQGEVEQIALMKPKAENENEVGLLEFLEDIIGSNRLKAPLAKLQVRVDEMNELRAEKMNRVKAIQKEKDALEGPRNEAIKFIELENDIVKSKNKLYQLHRQNEEKKKEAVQKTFDESNEKLTEARKEANVLKEKKSKFVTELKEKQASFGQHMSEKEKLEKKKQELEMKDMQRAQEISHNKKKGRGFEQELERERTKLEALEEIPKKHEDDIELLTARKETLEKDKTVAEEELDEVRKEIKKDTEKLSEEKDVYQKQLLGLEKGVNESKSKMDINQSEFDLYVSRQRTARANLDRQTMKLESDQRAVNDKKSALKRFQSQLPDMEKERETLSSKIQAKKQEKEELQQEVRNLKSKESEVRSKTTQNRSRSKVLSFLFDAQKKGKLKGIVGRLGDLASIPHKYDVAISTACGRLDNIVVETADDAAAVIKLVREHDVGLVHLLILEKMTHWTGRWNDFSRRYPEGGPEDTKRLFDLIKVNEGQERLLPVFYYSLFDTLVCKDLEQGTKINKQGRERFRFVTLNGNLIEASGALTGGGKPIKGKMKLDDTSRRSSVTSGGLEDEDPEEFLKNLQTDISTKTVSISALEEAISAMQSKYDSLGVELATMKSNAPRLEMEVKALEDQLDVIKKNILEAEKAVKDSTPDPEKLKQLDEKLETSKKEYANSNAQMKVIEKKIEEIDDKIKEVMDKTLGSAKKKLEKISSELKAVNSDISKKSAAIKKAQRDKDKSMEAINRLEKEVENCQETIRSLKEAKKKIEEEFLEVTTQVDEIQAQTEGYQEELEIIHRKIAHIEKKESKLESDHVDLKHEVDKLALAVKEREAEVKKWTDKLSELELQAIPDDDWNAEEEEEFEDQDEVTDGEEEVEVDDEEVTQEESTQPKEVQSSGTSVDSNATKEGNEGQEEAMETSPETLETPKEEIPVKAKKKILRKIYKKVSVTKKRKKHSLPIYSKYELSDMDGNRVKSQLDHLEQQLKEMKPNMAAIEDYKKKVEVYLSRSAELRETTEKRDLFKSQFETLRTQRMSEFKEGFLVITSKLKEMYRMITAGGDADLEWADSLDPFSEGINFSVRPNKKTWKNISNLSGGEKTLSSLSLIFALHYYKPSPLYVMDEIDAALDFKNVSIIAHYIKERTKNTQFIIISLRNNMYELAHRLVGIYKTHNCTKTTVLVPTSFPSDLTRTHGTQALNLDAGDRRQRQPLTQSQKDNRLVKTSTQVPPSTSST